MKVVGQPFCLGHHDEHNFLHQSVPELNPMHGFANIIDGALSPTIFFNQHGAYRTLRYTQIQK